MSSPFTAQTDMPLVALRGARAGYIQLAPALEITTYQALPDTLFIAAKAWAARLEAQGAKRVYWITLSEVVPHLHIHLYPRWTDDEPQGLPLFEARNQSPQPAWTEMLADAFNQWSDEYAVHSPMP